MTCGFMACLKYTVIGVGVGALAGGALYFMLPKRRPMFGPASRPSALEPEREPPALPRYEEFQPATAGFGWRSGRGRRW